MVPGSLSHGERKHTHTEHTFFYFRCGTLFAAHSFPWIFSLPAVFLYLGLCFHSVLKSASMALRSPFVGGWVARPFNHILSSSSFSIRPPPHATCFPSHSFPLSLPQSLDNVQIKQRFLARRKERKGGKGERHRWNTKRDFRKRKRKKEKGTVRSGGKRLEKADVFVLHSTLSRVNSAPLSLLPSRAGASGLLSLLFCSVILVNIMASWSLQVRKRSVLLGIGSGVARKKEKGRKKEKAVFLARARGNAVERKEGPYCRDFLQLRSLG